MRKIVSISIVILLSLVACNTSTPIDFGDDTVALSIAELKRQCRGTSFTIAEELKIAGVVTANDIRGEFPYAIVLEDASGGIEISIDHTALADLFPLGAAVTVYCSGLALGEYGGRIRLGAKPTGTYSIDRIPRLDIGRYLRCTELNAYKRRPHATSISELDDSMIDTYVSLQGVHFTDAGLPWCDYDPQTNASIASRRTLRDEAGHTLPVRISADTHYAKEPIPQGTGSVNGVVDYFNGALSLRIINYEVDFTTAVAAPPTAYPSAAEYSSPTPTR